MGSWTRRIALLALVILPATLLAGWGLRSFETDSGREPDDPPDPRASFAAAPSAMAPSASTEPKPKDVSTQVVIDNFAFRPATLTIEAGTKVTWVNRDDVPHTATSTQKPRAFHSGTLDTDDKFEHVFNAPGTYEYFCAVHPHMTGKIIVK
jgi:plastocyanin